MLGYKAGTYLRLGGSLWHLHEDLDHNDCAQLYGVWSAGVGWIPGGNSATFFGQLGIVDVPATTLSRQCCATGQPMPAPPAPQTVQTVPVGRPSTSMGQVPQVPGPFQPQPGTYWASKTTGGLTRTFKYLAHDGSAWYWSITTLEWVSGAIVPGPNPRAILPADLAILGLPLSPPGGWPGGSGTVCLQSARDIGLGQALHDHFKDRLKTPDTMGRCSKCGAPLHAMLDAYYGRNTAVAGMCSNCRPRGA